jgi:hypothetical protein
MSETSTAATIQLSRDELLLTLRLLGANTIPGLDPDPEGPVTAEEEALALRVAGRGLQARGLARIDKMGQLLLHELLLAAVGTCVFAQNSLFIYHWPVVNQEPDRYFIHNQDDNIIIIHSRPASILHGFTLIPDASQLVDQIFALCHYNELPPADHYEFTISSDIFVQVRQMAQNSPLSSAQELLMDSGQSEDVAIAFASTLGNEQARVTVFQSLHSSAGIVHKQDFTLLQDKKYSWLLSSQAIDSDEASLVVRTIATEYLETTLSEGFSQ